MSSEVAACFIEQIPRLPPRAPDSHKGNFGRVLIVAGSRGMSGAACLAGVAALRGGAGLVRVAVPESVWPVVAGYEPCYLTWPLPAEHDGRLAAAALPELLELAKANDVLAIGPGLGQSPAISQIITTLLTSIQKPTIVDADAINALAGHAEHLQALGRQAIITPHPGEFARLLGTDSRSVQARRTELAVEFSQHHRAVTVLKGHQTVVTDGDSVYVNRTGNPGMATGGSGDVLTGLLAGLLGQGMPPFEAAALAVYVHGLAGDLAARDLGHTALIASDLLKYLSAALRTVES